MLVVASSEEQVLGAVEADGVVIDCDVLVENVRREGLGSTISLKFERSNQIKSLMKSPIITVWSSIGIKWLIRFMSK